MYKFITFFFLLVNLNFAFSQNDVFPASWEGVWEGKLSIYNAKGLYQMLDMQLEIHRIDTTQVDKYSWGIVYVNKETDWRPYELLPVDTARGIWRIDEKNGIQMEGYLFDRVFLCWFTVSNNRILCQYEKSGDQLTFTVISGPEVPASVTGNTRQGDEEIPEVKTYPFSGYQQAVLRRKK